MKKLILYIASSLDGYIATPEHSVEWLENLENPDGNDYGYHDFMNQIDTVIMGRKTYEIIKGFGADWPYSSCETHIMTRQTDLEITSPNTSIIQGDIFAEISKMKQVWSEKNIWFIGGGLAIRSLLEHQCIDEIMLFTVPVLLGHGIPLFPESRKGVNLSLIEHRSYPSGMLFAHYMINKE
jgi:dihydrofolate reductase